MTRTVRLARAAVAIAVLTGGPVAVGMAGGGSAAAAAPTAGLTARTVLSGAAHGWSSPDDLTSIGPDLYVSFQNGVPSTGGGPTGPTRSTIVEFRLDGTITRTWQVTGKCDGLTADPDRHRLIATVNEDGNSSLYTVSTAPGTTAPVHYAYDASPLPHGGGTDSVVVHGDTIYVAASAPTAGGPALYRVALHDSTAHLVAAPFFDTSTATVANVASRGTTVHLALTDPDASTFVPDRSPRFAGDYMLDAQGDQQAVFASDLGASDQKLRVLNLSQAVDDTAFATSADGALVGADSMANAVVAVTGALTPGVAYTAVTPGNANNAPPNPAPNYLGSIDLATGSVRHVPVAGIPFAPHSLTYVPPTR